MGRKLFVAYRRSSTPGKGLSREVQWRSIEAYIRRIGGELIASYEDVGSATYTLKGLARAQPNLAHALDHARRRRATIVAADLDRLTRCVAVLVHIQECGPSLVIVQLPNASPFVLQIYAAVAEDFRRKVGRRVKVGMAEARAKGTWVPQKGCPAGTLFSERVKRYTETLRPIIEKIRRRRAMSALDVADELNRSGLRTVCQNRWTERSVRTVWCWLYPRWDIAAFRGLKCRSAVTLKAAAMTRARDLRLIVAGYQRDGAKSGSEIAERLNSAGWRTLSGGPWCRQTANKLLRRLREGGYS